MLFYLYFVACTQIEKKVLSVHDPFEHDIQKIAKINSQQEIKGVFQSQKLVSAKHKKSPIRKIKLPQKVSAT